MPNDCESETLASSTEGIDFCCQVTKVLVNLFFSTGNFVYSLRGVSLYGKFLANASIDEVPRPLVVSIEHSEDGTARLVLTLSHFWSRALIDPGM